MRYSACASRAMRMPKLSVRAPTFLAPTKSRKHKMMISTPARPIDPHAQQGDVEVNNDVAVKAQSGMPQSGISAILILERFRGSRRRGVLTGSTRGFLKFRSYRPRVTPVVGEAVGPISVGGVDRRDV